TTPSSLFLVVSCFDLFFQYLSSIPFCLFLFFFYFSRAHRDLHSFPTRRSSDLSSAIFWGVSPSSFKRFSFSTFSTVHTVFLPVRSEEHTSELQSRFDLVCRLLLEKKN